ncbi:MAG: GPW/gp25 family protein [Frankiaceae bacterium]|nr:GPW/gp25 family protein [Frankiaceae bacterium]MBV9368740.1 GPW/gp25 family protein [Frankiales bacterium]
MNAHIAFPLATGRSGGVATVGHKAYVEQLVEQLLFTSPGERVNRPTFGCGLEGLVFGTLTDEVITATRYVVQASLQKWLRDFIDVDDVAIAATGGQLTVTVKYTLLADGQAQSAVFHR